MKTWKKIILWLGLISCLLGLGFATWGYRQGGLSDLQKKPIDGLTFVEKDLDSFDNITINSVNYDLIVMATDTEKPSISYYEHDKKQIDTSVKDKTLTINNPSSPAAPNQQHINFLNLKDIISYLNYGHDSNFQTIIVKLPRNQVISSLSGEVIAGQVDLSNFTLNQANLNLNAGDLTLTKMIIKQLDASIGAGTLNASDTTFNQTKIAVDAGDFDGNQLTFTGKNSITTSEGDITINLKDYLLNVQVDTSLGDQNITDALKNTSQNSLDISTQLGDITVE